MMGGGSVGTRLWTTAGATPSNVDSPPTAPEISFREDALGNSIHPANLGLNNRRTIRLLRPAPASE